MARLNRALVIPRDSADINQLTALLHSHPWMLHVDKEYNPVFKVGQLAYFLFNIERVHSRWSGSMVADSDPTVTVNEVATQLRTWAAQPRYNKQQ